MCAWNNECVIEGIKTVIPFQKQILLDENFNDGNFTTAFLENFNYKKEERV